MMKRAIWVCGLVVASGAAAAEGAREVVSGAAEREATAITVYNDNLALVKERRKLNLPAGLVRLSLREVSGQLRPETALLRAVSGSPIALVEQNFDFDLLTPAKLLEKYVGREVTVIRSHPTTGEERREKATVLAANSGTVLRFADRIETGVPGRIVFDGVPANLRDRPTLSVLLEGAGGSQSLELSYLTGGIAWKADYVANLSADGGRMDLSGWVTLTNRSGAAYSDATLQLVAGTVNRVRPQPQYENRAMPKAAAMAKRADVAQEALMDYHLYSFERPTSIADNQTKQLALLSAGAIPVRREYLLAGNEFYYRERYGQIGQKLKPAVFVEFDNKGGQLGKPLPAGVVRVYARDSKGAAQFVGEDRIEHTAKNEKLRLKLGEAFDITADRKQTSYKKLGDTTAETSYRIELRNAKDEAVTVRVQEPLPGDWEMVQETQKSTKESARLASWNVEVPAGGAATLEYTVRVRW
ncbi:MAG: DUF4139 domain-containing protein [Rhodocyclales bacterium GWA2_65_20]|nr:MAG: DUF4139 domain-containing protein [Rhodocyclales bacterium GWA2_65_20]